MAPQSEVGERDIMRLDLVVVVIQEGLFSYPSENWVVIDVKYLSVVGMSIFAI